MKSLVIGNTSQLSYYFPDDFIKISSRNIDFSVLKKSKWNKIVLCFGESRKFIDDKCLYEEINVALTVKVVNELKDYCNYLYVYSTCELWNRCNGKIDLSMPFSYYSTYYLDSKYKLTSYLLEKQFSNVFILFPFNFNSPIRNKNFLFGKIFDSIIHKNRITIGDTYFYRDLIHPDFVVNTTLNTHENKIIGSGRLTFVNDFIKDLYAYYNMDYNRFVIENQKEFKEMDERKEYYLNSDICLFDYKELFKKTLIDIERFGCTTQVR